MSSHCCQMKSVQLKIGGLNYCVLLLTRFDKTGSPLQSVLLIASVVLNMTTRISKG
jgi:hypothetical protein